MFNYMEELYIFAYNTHAAHTAKGWSQMRFAAEVGVESAYLNKILNAHRQPGFEMIHRIADALQMPAGDLLSNIPPTEAFHQFKESLIAKHRKNLEKKAAKAAAEKSAPVRSKQVAKK
ncbi:helix-turn-helix domain-containing protein [Chitinophaga sp. sic0106]|uniref:helix-turn-helix domain-containing protein n=1 Tax=Chitinophaga sp. sic0106 TaxID=2854785 RepID=UPI001C46A388|nr:helix-turn-helix transcriptional regulator [Chitinophaga sp. sic0106]MBV7532374.1 helix-turn-helix transcriptional regulator [Chitinophaga sp. sic0106]